MMRRLANVLLMCLMAACTEPPRFHATDITGSEIGADFALTDHTGKLRHLADFRGQVVVVFFGYTQCPDVCSPTLSALSEVMTQLGADAQRVQVLFITLDPERDTPALLSRYVPTFNPSFLGLSGDLAATEATAKAFRVFYKKQPGSTPGTYFIDHSAGSYVFDPQGRVRLYLKHEETPQRITADLKLLLSGK